MSLDCIVCLREWWKVHRGIIPSYGMNVEDAATIYKGDALCLRHFGDKARLRGKGVDR